MARFVIIEDYQTLIDQKDLDIVDSSTTSSRESAEDIAQEQISGYLRNRYNITEIFNKTGSSRNKVILMYMIDIAVFHMHSKLPGRMGMEIREKRYDDVLKSLEKIQKGIITLDIPYVNSGDETDINNPVKWGSATKNNNDY